MRLINSSRNTRLNILGIMSLIAICFIGCSKDPCVKNKLAITLKLDSSNFKKIPYHNYDTIVFKLAISSVLLPYYAKEWEYGYEPENYDPCIDSIRREFRKLTFTCIIDQSSGGLIERRFNGTDIIIKHYIKKDNLKEEEISIDFHGRRPNCIIPLNQVGYPFDIDSITILNRTYYNVNFFPHLREPEVYPFGNFYSAKDGLLRVHYIDRYWPVPEGGTRFDIVK